MSFKHESQFFEWLPYNAGTLDSFPKDAAGRRAKLAGYYKISGARQREKYAAQLAALPGNDGVQYVEAFQISEYGRRPSVEELQALFPFI